MPMSQPSSTAPLSARLAAWGVHVFTGSGAVWGLLALLAVISGDATAAWGWLALALLVDGADGPLARHFRVKEVLPSFDGAALDLIVDYLTYVFVPVLFLWKFALLPAGWMLPLLALILVSSLHLFCKLDMKADDNHFVGFPAVWNLAVLYMYLLDLPPALNAGLTLILVALTFAPARFVHPVRVVRFRAVTLALVAVWLVATAVLVLGFPARPSWAMAGFIIPTLWVIGISGWRTLRERAGG